MPNEEKKDNTLAAMLAGLGGGGLGALLGGDIAKKLRSGEGETLKRLSTAPTKLGPHHVIPLPFITQAQRGRLAREAGKLSGGDVKGTIAGAFAPSYLTESAIKDRVKGLKGMRRAGAGLDIMSLLGGPPGSTPGAVHRGFRDYQVAKAMKSGWPKAKGVLSILSPWGMNAMRRDLAAKEMSNLMAKQRLAKGLKYGLPVAGAALATGLAKILMDKRYGKDEKKEASIHRGLEEAVLTYGIYNGLEKCGMFVSESVSRLPTPAGSSRMPASVPATDRATGILGDSKGKVIGATEGSRDAPLSTLSHITPKSLAPGLGAIGLGSAGLVGAAGLARALKGRGGKALLPLLLGIGGLGGLAAGKAFSPEIEKGVQATDQYVSGKIRGLRSSLPSSL